MSINSARRFIGEELKRLIHSLNEPQFIVFAIAIVLILQDKLQSDAFVTIALAAIGIQSVLNGKNSTAKAAPRDPDNL